MAPRLHFCKIPKHFSRTASELNPLVFRLFAQSSRTRTARIRPWIVKSLPNWSGTPYIRQTGRGAGPAAAKCETFMWKIFAATVLVGFPTISQALTPLHENPVVVKGFYAIGLADEVRKNCDDISPRLLRAYYYLKSLERYARDSGYSESQIQELIDNKSEKEKLRAQIRADLAERGASPKNPEGYCTVGLEEIAKGSAAGKLLRAK